MKPRISKESLEMAVLLAMVVICIGLFVLFVRDRERAVRSVFGVPECFVFADGWELVSRDMFYEPHYICRSVETGQYAGCAPIPVNCQR